MAFWVGWALWQKLSAVWLHPIADNQGDLLTLCLTGPGDFDCAAGPVAFRQFSSTDGFPRPSCSSMPSASLHTTGGRHADTRQQRLARKGKKLSITPCSPKMIYLSAPGPLSRAYKLKAYGCPTTTPQSPARIRLERPLKADHRPRQ